MTPIHVFIFSAQWNFGSADINCVTIFVHIFDWVIVLAKMWIIQIMALLPSALASICKNSKSSTDENSCYVKSVANYPWEMRVPPGDSAYLATYKWAVFPFGVKVILAVILVPTFS